MAQPAGFEPARGDPIGFRVQSRVQTAAKAKTFVLESLASELCFNPETVELLNLNFYSQSKQQ